MTEECPYFQVNGKDNSFVLVSHHLLKSLENSKNKVSFESRPVSWDDIIYFYNKDSQNPVRCAPKLSEALFPNSFQKMSVKLASQVMSDTVASGMLASYSSGLLSCPNARFLNTAEYVLFFNKLFDIFHSSNFEAVLPTKKIFSGSDDQLKFLYEAVRILKTIRVEDENGSDITNYFNYIEGWILNISSLRRLWRFLSQSGFTNLQTRRLCQDNLEHYFGHIRRGGGRSVRITPYMFCNLFKKSWGLRYANIVVKGNCEPVPQNENFSIAQSHQIIASVCNDNVVRDLSWQEFQGLPRPGHIFNRIAGGENLELDLEVDFLKENAFAYFCGYLYLKIYKTHACSQPLPYIGEEDIST